MLTSALLGLAIMSLGIAIILLEKRINEVEQGVIYYKIDNLLKISKEVSLDFKKALKKSKKK